MAFCMASIVFQARSDVATGCCSMGADGGLRHVVHKRVHLERHQPKARKKLGYLEKHKDYVKRAKDFHKKEATIKKLHRKAYFKNEDEFSMTMTQYSTNKEGKTKKTHLTQEEQHLSESQDALYVNMREQIDKKAIQKRSEQLHFLEAEKPNRHTIFVDEDDLEEPQKPGRSSSSSTPKKLKDFDVAGYFETHPALLKRKANRLRLKQLQTKEIKAVEDAGTKAAYHELLQLQERSKKLTRVREELEQRSHLRQKGVAIQVSEGGKGKPAQYRWLAERKR